MPGPPPSDQRRRYNPPARGDWRDAEAHAWRHGDAPKPPSGVLKATREAWASWFASWPASFWQPEDVPALRMLARLYDACERGELQRHAELRMALDGWGLTPKGQQDRRWRPPAEDEPTRRRRGARPPGARYGHLRAVGDGAAQED